MERSEVQSEMELLREVFVTEAEKQLGVLEGALLDLEESPDDPELLGVVFRAVHTVKGSAAMIDLEGISRLAHAMEEVLSALRSGDASAGSDIVTLLLQGVDALRSLTDDVAADRKPDARPFEPLRLALASWRASNPEDGSEAAGNGPAAVTAPRVLPTAVRVDVSKLDRLLEAVGEIGLSRRAFAARLARLESPERRALTEAFDDGDRALDEVREAVMDMRLVPIGPRFRRFGRAVRDAAAATQKEVAFEVEDAGVELDMAVVEQLVEPLTHLIRNAVDHGIESPEDRERAGKPRHGTVTLGASRDGSTVLVEVADDGAGISRERLETRAAEWGVSNPEELDDRELWELLFRPGFSTAAEVTDLSGRGVGMDAVRSAVEALRGSVQIRAHEGVGTTVSIRVPLTLATIAGLEVDVGEGTYILPLESVVECVALPPADVPDGRGVMQLSGRAVPVVALRGLFSASAPAHEEPSIVVVRHGRHTAGLVVDGVAGELEAVMRPLAPQLEGVAGIGGSVVLEDGRIGLVVDVPSLLRELEESGNRSTSGPARHSIDPSQVREEVGNA